MTENTENKVLIEYLAYGGDSVGKLGERVVFIPGGVPGDKVLINIVEDKGTYLRGEISEIIEKSPDRVKPFCEYAGICGGCQWQHIEYPVQVSWKERIIRESFARIAKIPDAPIEPCIGTKNNRGYRSVARFPIRKVSGDLLMGFFERNTNDIVDVSECPVAIENVNRIASMFRSVINGSSLLNNLREVTIQSSCNGESLIKILTRNNNELSEISESILRENKLIKGIGVRKVFPDGSERILKSYGEGYRTETIGGNEFKISEGSFFQVNPEQAETLVAVVREMTEGVVKDTIIDAYGGVGLFSLSVADANSTVHLFDFNDNAVKDSIVNFEKAGIKLVPYILDALPAFEKIGKCDLVIADPPRTGLGRKAVNAVCSAEAETVIYISCNPTTLARDIAIFAENGYLPERITPVDMFPHTYHIETVVKLVKK